MNELKPCPFCGGPAVIDVIDRYPRSGKNEGKRIDGYSPVCKNFNCVIYQADNTYCLTKERATDIWNRRAT